MKKAPASGAFLWAISGGLPNFRSGVGSGTEGFRQRRAAGVTVFDGVKDLAIGNALANTNVHGDGVEKGC